MTECNKASCGKTEICYSSYGANKPYEDDVTDLYRLWTGKTLKEYITVAEHLIVARDGNKLVGAAQLIAVPDVVQGRMWGLVENVFVHPDYRRRGIGKELMRAVEIQAYYFQLAFIKLTSRKQGGQALYRSLGYREGVSFYKTIVENPPELVVGCISGYFDPLHGGHLDHSEEARKHCDILVAIAGTENQCDNKPSHNGEHFLSWDEKVRLLKKIGVSRVVPNIDTDGSCAKSILSVKPNVYIKGKGFTLQNIPKGEVEACNSIGCAILVGVGERLNESRRYWNKNNEEKK